MSRPRLALLIGAHEPANTRRNFRRELDADLVEYHLPEGDVPERFGFDGAVVTGSRSSVYHDEPWIPATKEWVGDAVDRDVPFLGVCWGHQLLADVLGGTVEDMGEYEIGYHTVEHSGSPLFESVGGAFTVFTTHSDRVVELPPGAEPIAENDYGNHGFRAGDVFGVQFHPEYDAETAESVTRGKDDQLTDERIERVLAGITPENYRAACEAKRLFENFVGYVRRQREGAGDAAAAADD
ncbi:MAG: type 1 glutamine amidotransferase [Haloarculaceae archaeon]